MPDARPELIIGVVAPVGADLDSVIAALDAALSRVGYSHDVVRISSLFSSIPGDAFERLVDEPEDERYRTHIAAGNELRRAVGTHDAAARLAIARVRELREDRIGSADDALCNEHAFILRSLKTPAEVELLRGVYRSRVLFIGVHEQAALRETRLATAINRSRGGFDHEQDRSVARHHPDG